MEQGCPVRLHHYGIACDSGGAGHFRGGCGVVREYEILCDGAVIPIRINSVQNPPWGMDGGRNGGTGSVVLNPGTDRETAIPPLSDGTLLRRGDVVRIVTGGGGGAGHPFDRPAERVLEDVRGGFVGREAAARDYGVILDGNRIHVAATEKARANRPRDPRFPPQGICR